MVAVDFIIGSKNRTKIKALKEALDDLAFFFDDNINIEAIEVESYDQPLDEEVEWGAITRARNVLKKKEFINNHLLYAVGVEGGIVNIYDKPYITAYRYIQRATDGESHGAWTAFMECPQNILKKIKEKNEELGPIITNIREKTGWKWRGGAFGTLSGGKYTRKDALKDALVICITRFFIKC